MSVRFQNINFQLDKIPPMPEIAAQIIELINAPESSANLLARVVAKDPAVSAKVLQIANSSFYSMSRKVTTLPTAIVVLGEKTLKNLVLAASLRGIYKTYGKIEKMLWEDAMVCALGSRFLAQKLLLVDSEEAFMAGLFRHIGKVVLCNQEKREQQMINDMTVLDDQAIAAREKQTFGATHAEIGAAVLEHWQLSETMSLIALHHFDVNLAEVEDPTVRNMICLVNIAGKFPRIFGVFGQPQQIPLEELPGAIMLRLDAEELEKLVEEFRISYEENRKQFLA